MSRKTVVFVPGFPGTSLEDESGRKLFPPPLGELASHKEEMLRRLAGPDDPNADDGVLVRSPIRYSLDVPLLDLGKEAQSLYDILEDLGYDTQGGADFRPVGWDWRRRVDSPATLDALEAAIRGKRPTKGGVMLVVHSTGGLVARALLERRPAVAELIDKVVAIGVPWYGLVKVFVHLDKGKRLGVGPVTLLSALEARTVMRSAHAAYDLLPPDPTRSPSPDPPLFVAEGRPATPLREQGWLDVATPPVVARLQSALARLGGRGKYFEGVSVPVVNLVGWGYSTLTACDLTDGETQFHTTKDGDGTVPRSSAAWLEHPDMVSTLYVPIGTYGDQLVTQKHSQLWRTPPVRRILGSLLAGNQTEPHVWAAADADDAVDPSAPVRVRMVATDERGRPLQDAFARVLVAGSKELDLSSGRAETTIHRWTLQPNIGSHIHRFEVRFRWNANGSQVEKKRPILIEV